LELDLRTALRIYAITPDSFTRPEHYAAAVGVAVGAGVAVVQYRYKGERSWEASVRCARTVVEVCHAAGALAIVNDSLELALEVAADGVHLGPADASPRDLPAGASSLIVGASTGDPETAVSLVHAGVDYLGVGAIYEARLSKPNASSPRGVSLLREMRALPDLDLVPIVAIGGITSENAGACFDAGADGVAAIRGILGVRDIRSAVRSYQRAVPVP
jgi:thiamine-phosphate pyrophosphorylase